MKPFVKFRIRRMNFSDRADWAVYIAEAEGEFKSMEGRRVCAVMPQGALDGRYSAKSLYLTEDFSFHKLTPTNNEDPAEDEMSLYLEYNLSANDKEGSYEPRDLAALIDASYLEDCGFPNEDYEVSATVPIMIINNFAEIGEEE